MSAQQEQLNAISNDLANLSTSGYKSERVAFSDLLYNPVSMAGTVSTDGAGASAKVIGRSQAQGALQETGDPLDLAIEGE
ncbi:MAG: flagellar hook-basal body complex protein, partial [Solirubrobacteraceae bacterium]